MTTAPPGPPPDSTQPPPGSIDRLAQQQGAIPPSPAAHAHGLAAAVRTVSAITLLSRIMGLARDVLLARLFGATAIGSAFAAGFAIPNTFRRLFGEGALTAAFIPEYAQAQKSDPAVAQRIASVTILILFLATALLTVTIELGLLTILAIAPGGPDRRLSLHLIMIMLPFMPLVCTAAVLAGILQVESRFGPASSGPILLNGLIIIVGGWSLATGQLGDIGAAYLLGVVTVLSGLTQCLWFLVLLRRQLPPGALRRAARAAPGATRSASAQSLVRIRRRFIPALIGMGTLQISSLIDMVIAMWPIWFGPTLLGFTYALDERSNSILTFTQRLYQFPLGVFGIAVATAAFPLLSRHADEPQRFAETLRRGLRLSLFIGLPASVGLLLVRHDLTTVLFSGGKGGFLPPDLARSSAVLLGYAPAVWAYSLNHVLTRAFYARGDTATPLKVAIIALGANLIMNLILIWHLREAGLAWATSLAAMVQCALLALILRRRLGLPMLDRPALAAAARTILATAIMGVLVWLALTLANRLTLTFQSPWRSSALSLTLACATGGGAYLLIALLMRSEELRSLLKGRSS